MAEVGIHLNHIVVAVLVAPAHAVEVGGAETQLAFAFHNEQALRKLLHQPLDDVGGAVGRIVFDDEHIELLGERKDLADDGLNVLFLVVGRGDNKCVGHNIYSL